MALVFRQFHAADVGLLKAQFAGPYAYLRGERLEIRHIVIAAPRLLGSLERIPNRDGRREVLLDSARRSPAHQIEN